MCNKRSCLVYSSIEKKVCWFHGKWTVASWIKTSNCPPISLKKIQLIRLKSDEDIQIFLSLVTFWTPYTNDVDKPKKKYKGNQKAMLLNNCYLYRSHLIAMWFDDLLIFIH
jgi:hypothetical protein